jgi:hypothetical protein
MRAEEFLTEAGHTHTEIIKYQMGPWMVYFNDHAIIRGMQRGIGPKMLSDLITETAKIPDLENKIKPTEGFWVQDSRTNSSLFFKRLDIPGEPLALRCETSVKDTPRARQGMKVFRVNAYTGPETPENVDYMKYIKHISKFVGVDVIASNYAKNIQKGRMGTDPALITKPETQDSNRYDRAFNQAKKIK